MRFMYDHARLPAGGALCRDIDVASSRVLGRLCKLDLQALDVSDYTKWYLGYYLERPTAVLQRNGYLLALALACASEPSERSVVVDYGGGWHALANCQGLGVGTVVYTDIYDVSCHDACVIARDLGIEADHYVPGDLPDVIAYLQQHRLAATAIASYDVIEHVYDVDALFEGLTRLSLGPLTIVMASGANGANPFIGRGLARVHIELEHRDRQATWGHKERDALRSYASIRREMIETRLEYHCRRPAGSDLDLLTTQTRGMMESDIDSAVDRYVDTGAYPLAPTHPTNTARP